MGGTARARSGLNERRDKARVASYLAWTALHSYGDRFFARQLPQRHQSRCCQWMRSLRVTPLANEYLLVRYCASHLPREQESSPENASSTADGSVILHQVPSSKVTDNFASILLLTASSAWLALAQQSPQTGAFMSGRDKAGLRGPVKTVLEEQTFSGVDGQQPFTTTKTQYRPDGRILEDRTASPEGSGWVTSYTYYSDGRLLRTAFGKANSDEYSILCWG
jgi:hypothetical protein